MLLAKAKIAFVTVSIAGMFVLGAVSAYAQAASVTPSAIGTAGAKAQAWCQTVVPKISSILSNSAANLSKRQSWVATRKQKIQDRINKFKQKGLDVSKVTADSQTYSNQLDTWIADYQTFVQNLKTTQQFTCGQAQGQFSAALKTARTQRQKVKQDRDTFRDFYKNTLVVDFQALRRLIKANKGVRASSPAPTR